MNLTQAFNELGTKLTGATVAGTSEQDALNKIATALSGSACNANTWTEAVLKIAAALDGKSVVTLEEKSITAVGTYTPSSGKAWKKVVVTIE